MSQRFGPCSTLIYSPGTKVVSLKQVLGAGGKTVHPAGAVGVVVCAPLDREHDYRVRFIDGFEALLHHDQLALLAAYKSASAVNEPTGVFPERLSNRIIYRCVVGSRAFGLATDDSDTDRRGIYLPSADEHWSLYGVPQQLEFEATQEAYWELQKFLVMALKANPNVLECLYSPIVELATPLARELLEIRGAFLSKIVYQTYNGYVLSQFKRMQVEWKNRGRIKAKHVMHLIRLLLAGIKVLCEGVVPVDVGEHRDALLAIKRNEMPWSEIESWRQSLHEQFRLAYESSVLPERPDYDLANQFLIRARRLAVENHLP